MGKIITTIIIPDVFHVSMSPGIVPRGIHENKNNQYQMSLGSGTFTFNDKPSIYAWLDSLRAIADDLPDPTQKATTQITSED